MSIKHSYLEISTPKPSFFGTTRSRTCRSSFARPGPSPFPAASKSFVPVPFLNLGSAWRQPHGLRVLAATADGAQTRRAGRPETDPWGLDRGPREKNNLDPFLQGLVAGSLQVGQLVRGTVTGVKDIGAFVRLDATYLNDLVGEFGATAFLPRAYMTIEPVMEVSGLLELGERIVAVVRRLDTNTGNIVLSTSELEEEPGAMLRDRHVVYEGAERVLARRRAEQVDFDSVQVGQLVVGVVRAVEDWGVWLALQHPGKQQQQRAEEGGSSVGDERTQPQGPIRGASLQTSDTAALQAPAQTGSPAPGVAAHRISRASWQPELSSALELRGSLPKDSMSRRHVFRASDHFCVGDRVPAVVVGKDPQRRRLQLSSWQLEEEPGSILDDCESVCSRVERMLQRGETHGFDTSLEPPADICKELMGRIKDGVLLSGTVTHVGRSGVIVSVQLDAEAGGGRGEADSETAGAVEGHLRVEDISLEMPSSAAEVFSVGDPVTALAVSSHGQLPGRLLQLCTWGLEEAPGDMLRSPQSVFERALARWRQPVTAGPTEAVPALERAENGQELLGMHGLQKGQLVSGVVLGLGGDKVAYVRMSEAPGVLGLLEAQNLSRDPACHQPSFSMRGRLLPGDKVWAVIRHAHAGTDPTSSKALVFLGTKVLESVPGDMLRNRHFIWDTVKERYEDAKLARLASTCKRLMKAVMPKFETTWPPSIEDMSTWLRCQEQAVPDGGGWQDHADAVLQAARSILHTRELEAEAKAQLKERRRLAAAVREVLQLAGAARVQPRGAADGSQGPSLEEMGAWLQARGHDVQAEQSWEARANAVIQAARDKIKPRTLADGVIQRVKRNGVFVKLAPDMIGLLHISAVSRERVKDITKVFQQGRKVRVFVESMDGERGRISLVTNILERTPGDMLRDPQAVFDQAEETLVLLEEKVEQLEG